jgi:hypothetical protein
MEAMKYYENDITIRSVRHQSSLHISQQHAHTNFIILLFTTVQQQQ